ncbi:putative histidine-containing phosphotransfer protein [Sesbania bispinosa]|nr:putative histidine-containing phosphotransfer protein [Sesbania bispinosa]
MGIHLNQFMVATLALARTKIVTNSCVSFRATAEHNNHLRGEEGVGEEGEWGKWWG